MSDTVLTPKRIAELRAMVQATIHPWLSDSYILDVGRTSHGAVLMCPADAACAAHLRNAAPALLDAADEVEKLRAQVERIVAERCPKCGMGPMTRIDDGDTKYCSNCINLARADEEANGLNMWKGWADESEAECDAFREQVAKLRQVLVDLLGPEPEYSDKFPIEKKAWQVLAATTPKEQSP